MSIAFQFFTEIFMCFGVLILINKIVYRKTWKQCFLIKDAVAALIITICVIKHINIITMMIALTFVAFIGNFIENSLIKKDDTGKDEN